MSWPYDKPERSRLDGNVGAPRVCAPCGKASTTADRHTIRWGGAVISIIACPEHAAQVEAVLFANPFFAEPPQRAAIDELHACRQLVARVEELERVLFGRSPL